ncbi:Glutamyl-tRNA(Gln) amidotransferase subunit A like [Actinidia chinensis var. chinensis]|uniref:Glutamyl-tRNA(Gln) amidotransferase subunit A like n=1 Tax=Actinidia chinensis var. chinensis TaxID=1590841 RepID=A0A2R6QHM6_ACTCC|nr:Glutamyl-tRNA(Gln) amidotransferase subunit A like [Actinidia chinensis var. chinensis]
MLEFRLEETNKVLPKGVAKEELGSSRRTLCNHYLQQPRKTWGSNKGEQCAAIHLRLWLGSSRTSQIINNELTYRSKITGVISKDKIKKLNGISVKVIFLWFDITEVTRDGDDLNLSVGIASAQFGIDNFEESPQCGCGFDYVNGEREKNVELRINRFVSSSILE